MRPKQIIQNWVKVFNECNADKIASFYHEDAINHQVADGPVSGKKAIYEKFEFEFSNFEMNCIIENIFEDGNWAILEWKDPKGLRGCGFFQIIDDKIKFQRGYWDKLSFLKLNNLEIPSK